jgi:hypothetical protein
VTPKQKGTAALVAAFVLGGISGGAIGRLTAVRDFERMMGGPPREARARFHMQGMRRHLGLSDAQADKIQAIMDEADAQRDKLVEPCEPGLDDLRERTDARVRAVLDEDQRRELDALQARRGRGRHHGRHRMGPP